MLIRVRHMENAWNVSRIAYLTRFVHYTYNCALRMLICILQVVRPTNYKSMKVVRVMSALPREQDPQKHVDYYPNLPMFHYLTKMLRLHGLFFDEHVVWRDVQNNLKIMRGKVVAPPIGQGKRAQLRGKK